MQRVSFFSASLCLGLFMVDCSPPEQAKSESKPVSTAAVQPGISKPNLIWILLDACRATNLSCYGNPRNTTPNIDQLAARGLLCENTFSQGNITFTSVPSYMSGSYFPPAIFFNAPWKDLWRTPPKKRVLFPSVMKENGYKTALVTSHGRFSSKGRLWPLFDEAVRLMPGPSASVGPGTGPGSQVPIEELIDTTIAWIEENHTAPFFCYVHALDTHFPHYIDREPYNQWIDKNHSSVERLRNPTPARVEWNNRGVTNDTKTQRYSVADQEYLQGLHDGSLLYSDEHIGRLVRRLEELGLLDNTVIVVGSDHGEALGENGINISHYPYINTDEIQTEGVGLAVHLAGQIVRRELKSQDHSQLIDEALKQLPSRN